MLLGNRDLSFADEQVEVRNHHKQDRTDVEPGTDQIEVEDAVVVNPDAIIDPQAVMIEAIDTPVADVAVEALFGPEDLASRTNISLVKVLIEL
jgi:hypothetical protein